MGSGKEFIKKVILPVALIGILVLLFQPIYMVDGKINYLYMWILVGIPFGVRRMWIWLIPKNHDLGATVGIVAVNFIVGGLIGGFAAIAQLIQAVWYCLKCVIAIFKKKQRATY